MDKFKEHLNKYLSTAFVDELIASFSLPAKKAIVYNPKRSNKEKLTRKFTFLEENFDHPFAFTYSAEQTSLGKTIEHLAGEFYILDPSALLISKYLHVEEDDLVLDLCAAPGGKTISLALLSPQALIIANDYSYTRAQILSSNVERMGLANVIVTAKRIEDFSKNNILYDKIILDAPCSGSGMFRKETKMSEDWSYEKVLKLSSLQKELIIQAYQKLKPGGTMSYSTCSYSHEEDEEVIEFLLASTDAILENIAEDSSYFRGVPYKETIHLFSSMFPGEGHYLAIINKPGVKRKTVYKETEKVLTNLSLIKRDESFYAINHFHEILDKITYLRAGVKLATKINKNVFLDYALSHYVNSFTEEYEMNDEEVKQYLLGNVIVNTKYQNNYVLMKYNGTSLGFGKASGTQIKNHFPKGLRIKV